eukprot:4088216-Prymnesium_polylepis.1
MNSGRTKSRRPRAPLEVPLLGFLLRLCTYRHADTAQSEVSSLRWPWRHPQTCRALAPDDTRRT